MQLRKKCPENGADIAGGRQMHDGAQGGDEEQNGVRHALDGAQQRTHPKGRGSVIAVGIHAAAEVRKRNKVHFHAQMHAGAHARDEIIRIDEVIERIDRGIFGKIGAGCGRRAEGIACHVGEGNGAFGVQQMTIRLSDRAAL